MNMRKLGNYLSSKGCEFFFFEHVSNGVKIEEGLAVKKGDRLYKVTGEKGLYKLSAFTAGISPIEGEIKTDSEIELFSTIVKLEEPQTAVPEEPAAPEETVAPEAPTETAETTTKKTKKAKA